MLFILSTVQARNNRNPTVISLFQGMLKILFQELTLVQNAGLAGPI
jgi:hypothetical protein